MLSGKQLRSYLAYAVHGRKPIQLAQEAKQSSQEKGPPRDDRFKAWIRTLPCLCCGVAGRSEAAHTGSDGGMGIKASDYTCIPLCPACHTQGPYAYHRIGKRPFEKRFRLDFARACQILTNEEYDRQRS